MVPFSLPPNLGCIDRWKEWKGLKLIRRFCQLSCCEVIRSKLRVAVAKEKVGLVKRKRRALIGP